MITCFKCGKILPGTLRPGEYVMCKECEEKWTMHEETIKEGLRVPNGLTNMGYDQIIERIINRMVQPLDDMTVEALNAWLTGYATCQNDVLEIIGKLKDQYGR